MVFSNFNFRALAVLLILPMSACSGSGDQGEQGSGASISGADESPKWKVSSETDAMTDEVVQRASAVLSGNSVNAEARISCTSDRTTYTLTTFDKQGQPVEMVPNYGRLSIMLRIDDQPPVRIVHRAKLANQFEFIDQQAQLASASLLTLRLDTVNGEETIRLDQSAPSLRPMLDQCAQSIGDRRSKEQAARDQRAAEQHARCGDHPCPIEIPPPGSPNYHAMEAPVAPNGLQTGASSIGEINLDQLAECQDRRDGRGTAGAQLDCRAILARFERQEDEMAERDFELEAEENRREQQEGQ